MIRMFLMASLMTTTLTASAVAQTNAAAGTQPLDKADQQFLDYAAQDNQAEIQICLLAEKKAQSPAVKAFARLMVDDHVQVESQMAAVVNAARVEVPNGVGEDGTKTLAQLTPLAGASFDRQFIADQIKDHGHDIQKYQHQSQTTQDGPIRQFAGMTLPLLEQHLQLAEAVQTALRSGGAGTPPPGAPGTPDAHPVIGQQ
jgi:putative membrane protein